MSLIQIILTSCLTVIFAVLMQLINNKINNLETDMTGALLKINKSLEDMKLSLQHLGETQLAMENSNLKIEEEMKGTKKEHQEANMRIDDILTAFKEDLEQISRAQVDMTKSHSTLVKNQTRKWMEMEDDLVKDSRALQEENTRINRILISLKEDLLQLSNILVDQGEMERRYADLKLEVHSLNILLKGLEKQLLVCHDHSTRLRTMDSRYLDLNTIVSKQGHEIRVFSYQMSEVQSKDQRVKDEFIRMKDMLSDLEKRLKEEEQYTSNWKNSIGGKIYKVLDGLWNAFSWVPRRIGP